MKIKINKNFSKLEFVKANVNVDFEGGLSLWGVEICMSKEGALYVRHGHAYQTKAGEWKFQDHSFISPEIKQAILAGYKELANIPVAENPYNR